jgi:cytochrome c-type biogenesis protein CcmH/NrfG
VLKKDARNQKALVGLGRAQYEQGDRAAAIATLEQAVSIDGATSEAAEARAMLDGIRK